jgi:20S proteasome alpha/beta subunit
MNKSETLNKLAPALVKAQASMAGATKSAANPFFKSKYANLEEVIKVVKAAFAENGLSFVQFPVSGDGTAGVETIIMHESGEFISNEFLLKCAKVDPQGMGSAITYARRYGLQAACGIPSEDDDGNAASAPMTKERAIELLTQAIDEGSLRDAWKQIATEEVAKDAEVKAVAKARNAQFTTK